MTNNRLTSNRWPMFLVALGGGLCACNQTPPEPDSTGPAASASAQAPASSATAPGSVASLETPARARQEVQPVSGDFTLAMATEGLPGDGPLVAALETSLGSLSCELYADKAPLAVANFVGLARGKRPWKDADGQWVKKELYDGTPFHRIIKGFMIQGGDPRGNGSGGPGYTFRDEVWPGAAHDRRGLLCMANRGPNTNGSQFFILDGAARHLDHSFTILGECSPDSVIEKLADVPTRGDRPVDPPRLEHVTISRAPKQ